MSTTHRAEEPKMPAVTTIEVSTRPGIPAIVIAGAPDAYVARVSEILRQRGSSLLGRCTVTISGPLPPHSKVVDVIEAPLPALAS